LKNGAYSSLEGLVGSLAFLFAFIAEKVYNIGHD
jgi:hypothetical protein